MARNTGHGTVLAEGNFPDSKTAQKLMIQLRDLEIGRFVNVQQISINNEECGGHVHVVTNGFLNMELTRELFQKSLEEGLLFVFGWNDYLTISDSNPLVASEEQDDIEYPR